MMLKFFAGLVILVAAFALQFALAAGGIYLNLVFATLVSFALIFGFYELAAFVALAVFFVNWQPAASVEVFVVALLPFAVYLFRGIVHWQLWFLNFWAILAGFIVLYLVVSPSHFFADLGPLFFDVIGGWFFVSVALWPFRRWRRPQ